MQPDEDMGRLLDNCAARSNKDLDASGIRDAPIKMFQSVLMKKC
jgi:hypothetical protein